MNPINFKEANTKFGPPKELAESQCLTIPAHVTRAHGGSVDGAEIVVVAWEPTAEERERIITGSPIFISMIGGLSPHYLTTSFSEAINPA